MSTKSIFVATHPRACSTAFEREVFMTRTDALQCIHEPFGDAFYFGPERLSSRFENDDQERIDSGFSKSTYATIIERIENEASQFCWSPKCFSRPIRLRSLPETSFLIKGQGKRVFVKDIIHYLFPPDGGAATLAPSLLSYLPNSTKENMSVIRPNGISSSNKSLYPYDSPAESGNPTIIPSSLLRKFHFTFLIRHPRKSIPSYYRCTIPPLSDMTGFHNFMPSEAGYSELRRFFDYLRSTGQIGPHVAGQGKLETSNGTTDKDSGIEICVVDADDLLDNPAGIIKAYCKTVGLDYQDSMLEWNTEKDHQQAKNAFEKWKGFHEDAIDSSDLKPRRHQARPGTPKIEDHEWGTKFGAEAAKVIRNTVDENIEDYEYLKQFALKV